MRRALQLTGLFVIGVDIEGEVDAGTRVEQTAFVADYDTYEGRFGELVTSAIHRFGFTRAQTVAIVFDADCRTRSRMTSNMNGQCRDKVTGQADPSLPGGEEALKRDRIDQKAVKWVDSILQPHTDAECVAHATQWPAGPGGWGLSEEDANTLLTSAPRWDPANTTTRAPDRAKARTAYRRRQQQTGTGTTTQPGTTEMITHPNEIQRATRPTPTHKR